MSANLYVKKTIKIPKRLERDASLSYSGDGKDRKFTVSVSSDVPYKRYDWYSDEEYWEVLSHAPGDIDETRLKAGLPGLFNHDRNSHLNRATSYQNTGHRLYVGDLVWSESDFAQEKKRDMENGSLPDTSVGYSILDEGTHVGEKDGLPIYAFKWAPYEWSVVTIAADIGVGNGRGQRSHIPESDLKEISIDAEHDVRTSRNTPLVNMTRNMETKTPEQTATENNGRTATQERERIQEIMAIAKRANNIPEAEVQRAMNDEISVNAFRKLVFDKYYAVAKPINTPWNGDLNGGDSHRQSVAGQILSHPEFQRLREGGRKMISFELPDVRSLRELTRSTVTTADVGTTVMQVPGVQGVAFERLSVADLLAPGVTNSGQVKYPKELSFTPGATSVPETGIKPEQDWDVEPATSNVRKLAVFTKLSDELIEDSPAAEAYVRARLGFSVQKVEDSQLISGDGLGSNLLGLLSSPGLISRPKGADTTLDAIRKGIGDVEENTDFICSGIVVNVHDWTAIEILKDAQNRYLVGQVLIPDEAGRPRLAPSLWGRPVAVSKGIAQGTVLVGAFSAAAQLFRRTGLLIEATNSNEDDFKRNLILIRAEERIALAVYAGSAFCEVTGLPA